MHLPWRALATAALVLAAQHAAVGQCTPESIRVRVEVRPQTAGRLGEVISVQVIPRPNGRFEGSGMLTTDEGLLHLRFVDGEAFRCDGTIMIALDAVATLTPRAGEVRRAKRKLPLLIVAEDVEGEPLEPQPIDILIGGGSDPPHLTVTGVVQVIGPRGV